MSIDEAIERLTALENLIETEMEKISEEVAMSAMALIVNRIQQKGLEGRRYSKEKLPEFYFFDRELNAGGRALIQNKARRKAREGLTEAGIKIRKNKKLDEMDAGISYEEWRQANGLQTDHVDLTFSGRMFQNVGVIGTVRNGDTFVTIIGGFDKEVKDKLRWNAQRFGDFFMVTKQEREELKEIFKNRVTDLVKKAGLSNE